MHTTPMPQPKSKPAGVSPDHPSCSIEVAGTEDRASRLLGGVLDGGCCSADQEGAEPQTPIGGAARYARAIGGVFFLGVAGALATRRLPGAIALWPASLVATWFGVSHLVAGAIGYQGCPELGAIPSVMLGRRVGTSCDLWRGIDGFLEGSGR